MEIVARRADRVNFTRALGLAVELQGAAMVSLLLASGVRCDFEESDRPRPPHPLYYDICTLGEAPRLQVDDFAPPLVRAVRLGNVELVRLLLPGGADANVGYHGLLGRCGRQQQQQYGQDREMSMGGPRFSCRRVVQLAMDMGYEDIVRLLIVVGALMSGDPIRFGICPVMRVRWCRGPCIWRSRLGSRLRLWMR